MEIYTHETAADTSSLTTMPGAIETKWLHYGCRYQLLTQQLLTKLGLGAVFTPEGPATGPKLTHDDVIWSIINVLFHHHTSCHRSRKKDTNDSSVVQVYSVALGKVLHGSVLHQSFQHVVLLAVSIE